MNLVGNHDETMLHALSGDRPAATDWLFTGGRPALESYGIDPDSPRESWPENVPAEHLDFLRDLTLTHREGGYFFVHGGVRPGRAAGAAGARGPAAHAPAVSLFRDVFGAVVVHGHSPVKAPVVRHNRIAIDTGAVFGGKMTCLVLEGETLGFLTADPVGEPVSIAHR